MEPSTNKCACCITRLLVVRSHRRRESLKYDYNMVDTLEFVGPKAWPHYTEVHIDPLIGSIVWTWARDPETTLGWRRERIFDLIDAGPSRTLRRAKLVGRYVIHLE
jgi:hypothetical protein